jgi:hypothetical protein
MDRKSTYMIKMGEYNSKRSLLYSSPNIIRMRKLRRIGWTGHVARMDKRETYKAV